MNRIVALALLTVPINSVLSEDAIGSFHRSLPSVVAELRRVEPEDQGDRWSVYGADDWKAVRIYARWNAGPEPEKSELKFVCFAFGPPNATGFVPPERRVVISSKKHQAAARPILKVLWDRDNPGAGLLRPQHLTLDWAAPFETRRDGFGMRLRELGERIAKSSSVGRVALLQEPNLEPRAWLIAYLRDAVGEKQPLVISPGLSRLHEPVLIELDQDKSANPAYPVMEGFIAALNQDEKDQYSLLGLGPEGFVTYAADYRIHAIRRQGRTSQLAPVRTSRGAMTAPAWLANTAPAETVPKGLLSLEDRHRFVGLSVCSPRRWRAEPHALTVDPEVWAVPNNTP